MESGVVMVGAAAIAYYVYNRTRRDLSHDSVETHRHVEHAPQNWTGELYLFAEALRYLYLEYITHWQTADLFIGVFYLARQGIRDFPAAEVVAHGCKINPKELDAQRIRNLKNKFESMYRLLLYSQKLRNTSIEIPLEDWIDLEICRDDFVVYRSKASVLRPAYIIVKDPVMNCFVLAIRGTHSSRDIFTSLSGAAKPHHYVDQDGLVLGYSHLGMLAGARWIFKHCKDVLCRVHAEQPDWKLVVTGHSMGGGAAALLTMMIREQLPQFADTQCYTFACPACMTVEIARSCAPYVTTLIYGTDVVPTISPAAGDLLREEVSQSSWSKSFRQDIRSSAFVQSIETGVKGAYRSASSWASKQARAVSSLTTQCVRPREPRSPLSDDPIQCDDLRQQLADDGGHDSLKDSVPDEVEITRVAHDIAATTNNTETESHPAPVEHSKSTSLWRSSYDNWLRLPSLWWKRKVVAVENQPDGEDGDGVNENDVEGVFNAQGIEDEVEGDAVGGPSTNNSNSTTKRLLYPAGQIYHLVPEYILRADASKQESTSSTTDDTSAELDETSSQSEESRWYHPHEPSNHGDSDSAFVLFSDMPHEAYGRIRVCRSMVMDHFLPRYKTALKAAIQDIESALEKEKTQCI